MTPPIIRFDNLGGATVAVTSWLLARRWTCHGCGLYGPLTLNHKAATAGGNTHAGTCRALPRQGHP